MIGNTVGPYQFLDRLGEGGMGEVYRARDTKLNRIVAIKALHAAVAADSDRIARFEREAQLLASLHHPHIAGIYGLENAAGGTYLVLEFVDGKPLDALLKETGAMAPHEAVAVARQIADAIAAAHEKGIIHRDLKPGNVMVTADGDVKVLDFGLGKSLDTGRPSPEDVAAVNSPTISLGATQAGLILGTAGYMSPEQAKGRPADRRSDVWSFGCLLFELLAGSRAFVGDDLTDTIAAIVRGEPNWKALPAATPPALRHLLERALRRERSERLPDMSVVRYILSEPNILATDQPFATPVAATTAAAHSSRFWMVATALSIVAALALAAAYINKASTPPASAATPTQLTLVLPDDAEVAVSNLAPLAISPNGQIVAFPATRAGRLQLYISDLATGETKALDGTDNAISPFFSPDGRWIGFFAQSKLKKITIGGTSLQDVADSGEARGGTWAQDDVIYFAPTNTSGLWKVGASGGQATELTQPDPNASEVSHRYPHALAGGKALLFMVWTGPGSDEHRIEYLSLTDGSRQVVLNNSDGPVTVVGGRIIYSGRQDALLSVPWNPSQPSAQGVEPTTLRFGAAIDNEGVAAYAVAPNGTLVRLSGSPGRRLAKIVWINKSGATEPLPVPDRDYVSATLSPDGTRAAIQQRGATEEIWIYDFRTASFTPLLTPPGSSQAPVWTVDSKYIVYRGTRQGFRNIFRKAADGSGSEERLTNKPDVIHTPESASTDGKWILFVESGVGTGNHVWKVALEGRHDATQVTRTSGFENGGQISPDGRWIAFETNVSGRVEIWVQRFDTAPGQPGGPSQQVSREGGIASRWSRDGRELYFMTDDRIMAARVSGDTFAVPRPVVQGRYRLPANANTNYDVAHDGRFIHVLPIQPSRPRTRIEVVLNGLTQ